jgi:hypothetical protein
MCGDQFRLEVCAPTADSRLSSIGDKREALLRDLPAWQ